MSPFGTPGYGSSQGSPHASGSITGSSRIRSPRFGATQRVLGGSLSPGRGMEVDSGRFSVERGKQSEEARVFAVSDTLSIRLASSLPVEAQQAIHASGKLVHLHPSRDIFTGSIHVFHGPVSYGVIVSVQTCFVWKIDFQSAFHSPTCYIFPVPPPDLSSTYMTVPFASLVSFGSSREPGLIMVSDSGEIRFWDSIGIGLAGAERFSTTRVDLAVDEMVCGLERIDAMVFVARTKTRLHRLTVTARPGTGRFVVVSAPFIDAESRGSSWIDPFRILQKRSNPRDSGDIVTVVSSYDSQAIVKAKDGAVRSHEERSIWVLTNRNLMQWRVGIAGGEQCTHNFEVRSIIADAIVNGVENDKNLLDIELLDVSVDNAQDPTILISHAPLASRSSLPNFITAPLRVYALVRFSLSPELGTLKIKKEIEILPYELAADPRRALAPRFKVLQNSLSDNVLELTFSQFSDAFAFSSLEPPYQEQLHLKNADDMIFGFNVVNGIDGRDVLLLTTGMVLAARPHVGNIFQMKDDVIIGKAKVLKSTIRQAMKYGIKPENPLRFQLPGMADGESLKTAAEQMSHAFLTSDPDVVTTSLSMGSQLASRESSLKALVTFIGESGGLMKLSSTTREHLLADAEKLAAARGIWARENEQSQRSGSLNLLTSTVEAYLKSTGNPGQGAEALRSFFSSHIPHITALVPLIVGQVQPEKTPVTSQQINLKLLLQANELIEALFSNAFTYRSNNRATYQLTQPHVQPWTSDSSLIQELRYLFEVTAVARTQTHATSSSDGDNFGAPSIREELTRQLRELASSLFKAYSDRLEFLESRPLEGGTNHRERNRVEEEFQSLRPMILDNLVRSNNIQYAFRLAETYRDFDALSDLSYHAFADKLVPTSDRIRNYIHRFRGDFTSQLYKWYIEQGKLKLLFDQEVEYAEYIDMFFSQNPSLRVAWIHNIQKKDYQHAASALLKEAESETDREAKHLMLSIGKLATMAEGPAATPQDKVQGKSTLDSLFQRNVRKLLHGDALGEEDAVDILSMKDNTKHSCDFIDALNILLNSPYLSDGRKKEALRNVWRRIFLHDDWKDIHDAAIKTDYELMAKLRKTQLYQVLSSPGLSRNSLIPPSEATEAPNGEEIRLRWPGMASNQIQELVRDYERECQVLLDDGPSDTDFTHVRNMAEEDISR
ncbi:Non-repetitive/WGA-negative nucleoporin C-terminal-domain-containing protein [Hysterangium stoloniferum]|nr:Non-repetitive/WGA-negative nucleoporin C-terminal-domain-containing protein [Hysterangium stoloniferum]